jgi:Replication initiator protein, pSAM2
MPDGVIYKPCGNRRATTCPGCAETYRRDAYQLIRAGLIGGKGITPAVATHPAVFVTFTAPSFGPVHSRPVRTHACSDKTRCTCRPEPCHARRDAATCRHGRPAACFTRHTQGDLRLGQPLCPDCYDYAAHVVWNNQAAELWRRTKQAIERYLGQVARRRGLPPIRVSRGDGKYRVVSPVRVAHGKAAEYQARGAVHFHALLRLDGYDPADPGKLIPPPPGITIADLDDAIRWAATAIGYRTSPHPAKPGGWTIAWGTEIDIRVITLKGAGNLTDLAVASYLAKYSTKGTEPAGHASARITTETIDLYANPDGTHPERLIDACWRIGQHPGYVSLRRWAHMLGFGGHFLTKARRYSIRFRDLRQARVSYRRRQDTGPEHGPIRTADHTDEETVLVVGTFTYAGTGWKTSGDALLANTAADQARKRRQAGRDQLADEYHNSTTGRQAA